MRWVLFLNFTILVWDRIRFLILAVFICCFSALSQSEQWPVHILGISLIGWLVVMIWLWVQSLKWLRDTLRYLLITPSIDIMIKDHRDSLYFHNPNKFCSCNVDDNEEKNHGPKERLPWAIALKIPRGLAKSTLRMGCNLQGSVSVMKYQILTGGPIYDPRCKVSTKEDTKVLKAPTNPGPTNQLGS